MITEVRLPTGLASTKTVEEMLHPTRLQVWSTEPLPAAVTRKWTPAATAVSFSSGAKFSSFILTPDQPFSSELLQEIQGLACPQWGAALDGVALFYSTAEFVSLCNRPGEKYDLETIVVAGQFAADLTKVLAKVFGHDMLEHTMTVAGLVLRAGKKLVVYEHKTEAINPVFTRAIGL